MVKTMADVVLNDKEIALIEELIEKVTGLSFHIVKSSNMYSTNEELYFHMSEKFEIPKAYPDHTGRTSALLEKARKLVTDKLKQGELFTDLVASHKKECQAYESIIAEKEAQIKELMPYIHYYQLERKMRSSSDNNEEIIPSVNIKGRIDG